MSNTAQNRIFEFRLDLHSGVPVYRQIIDQVLGGTAAGTLTSGHQLPTVRQVAVDLSINPNTVVRAYQELEIRGVLETQQGTGTFIRLAGAEAEIGKVLAMGGVIPAVESGYLKSQLVGSHAARRARIESGEDKVVGVNCFETTEPSPLTADLDAAVQLVDPAAEQAVLAQLAQWRRQRDETAVLAALDQLKADAAQDSVNLMTASLACARAGVTTGEWSFALRDVFGEYRAPTGVSSAPVAVAAEPGGEMAAVREAVAGTARELGAGRLRLLLGKPGLDGHSNGAAQIAGRGPDAGRES